MESVELVVAQRAVLGEGPFWDWKRKLLYWIDGFGCKVFVFDPETGKNRAIDAGTYVGCVAPAQNGNLVVSLQDGFYSLNLETETFTLLANPEKAIERNRFNDGKVDHSGRFWSGSMSMDENGGVCDFEPTGALYRMNPDLTVSKAVDGVTLSNGLSWSPDDSTFYYIDTPTMRVDAFDYESGSGALSNRRAVVNFPAGEGVPDGMAVDEDGMLWIGHYAGGRISRWNPASGDKLEEIIVPAKNVTCCAFGGDELRDLYITTARVQTTEEELRRFPEAGGLFRVRVKTGGLPGNYFAGDI